MNPIIIHTVDGRPVDLARFSIDDVDAYIIATGLSNVCRFAGQLEDPYSVAQHSLLVASLVPQELRLRALLHDASEAWLGDVSHFLKHSEFMRGYRVLEEQVQHTVYRAYGIHPHGNVCVRWNDDEWVVKAADDTAALYERAIIRDRRPFGDIFAELKTAISSGFLKADRAELIVEMSQRLPHGYTAWSHGLARRCFYHELTEAAAVAA